jgi:hypothetical protein
MAKVKIEIGEDELIEALRALPPEKCKLILQKIEFLEKLNFRWISASELDNITALIAVGGDAV